MQRIDKSNTGFTIMPEQGKEYEVFYGFFNLGDAVNSVPEKLYPTKYWDGLKCFEQTVGEPESYIYVVEKSGEQIVDECRFFFSKTGRKHSITWSIKKLPWCRRFEKNAHEIVLAWDGAPERVRSEYIYLYYKNEPTERFQFLTDVIKPTEDKNGEYTDRYIFFPQGGRDGTDYRIGFDPLFLEKYSASET